MTIARLGPWNVIAMFEPWHGETPGGDRYGIELAPDGSLVFFLADATGHGERGNRFWTAFWPVFEIAWTEFVRSPGSDSLGRLLRHLNDELYGLSAEPPSPGFQSQLCMAAGWIDAARTLRFANCGLGIHVLPVNHEGLNWWPFEQSFGLRLGWLPSGDWEQQERSLLFHEVVRLSGLTVIGDAFFGDDHQDPEGVLASVQRFGEEHAGLPMPRVMEEIRTLPHGDDDATAFLVEFAETGYPAGAGS